MTKILNIDDNEIGRYTKTRMLQQAGYEVIEGETGGEALDLARSPDLDLIVLDVRLPDIDGFEVCRRLKSDPRTQRIPVLQISATYVGMEHRIQALELGADAYLTAPMEQPVLVATVRSLLRARDAERALRESEIYLRQTIDSLPQLVWTARPDGSLDSVSRQWCEYTGQPSDEDMGDGWLERVHPDDRAGARAAWDAAIAGGSDFDAEYRMLGAGGQSRWFKARARPIRDPEGGVIRWFGTSTDIDDIKHVEQELAQARDRAQRATAAAEEASRAKDEFMAVLSHELRTPLTPVLATVVLLQQDPLLDPRHRQSLELIRRNVELEARLIDDLLDVTRITRRQLVLERERIDFVDVVRRAVDVCRPDIEAHGLRFDMDVGSSAPCWVEGDPARLQQIFWNLLKNAIKFTPAGGRIGVRCRREGGTVVAEVRDTGVGIDAEDLPRLFDAFEQAERTATRRYGGLGLGLTISRNLVELHGGAIQAESQGAGTGSTFRVTLPLAEPPARGAAADQWRSPLQAGGEIGESPRLRVLLVEDHGDTVYVMKHLLEYFGHEALTAGDLATGLHIARSEPLDLVISDLGLPDGSGLDLMRQLHATRPDIKAIALSGYGTDEDVERSREAGFAAHLTKPVEPDTLRSTITRVMRFGD